jgi:hypothetical protein
LKTKAIIALKYVIKIRNAGANNAASASSLSIVSGELEKRNYEMNI